MLNFAVGTTPDDAHATKELYKSVLDALVAALEKADWARLAAPTAKDRDGRTLGWVYDDTARCPDCGGELWIFVPNGEGVTTTLQFCPRTWELKAMGPDGQTVAQVGRRIEAIVRSLPPGSKVTSMEIAGVKITVDPPYVVGGKDRGERK
jgi:hypothetical protein